jgi:hypothetical protein
MGIELYKRGRYDKLKGGTKGLMVLVNCNFNIDRKAQFQFYDLYIDNYQSEFPRLSSSKIWEAIRRWEEPHFSIRCRRRGLLHAGYPNDDFKA